VVYVKLKEAEKKLEELGLFCVAKHALVYVVLNSIFIICDIRRAGFPLGFLISLIWGSLLAIHLIRTKFKDSKFNNSFHYHLIVFCTFALVVFISYCFVTCRVSYDFRMARSRRHFRQWGKQRNHFPRYHQNYNTEHTVNEVQKHFRSRRRNHGKKMKKSHQKTVPPQHSAPPQNHVPPTKAGPNVRYEKQKKHKKFRYFGGYRRRHFRHHPYRFRKVVCHRSIFSMFFFFIPVYLWGILLFLHFIKFSGKTSFSLCCVTISFGQPTIGNEEPQVPVENQNEQLPISQEKIPIEIPKETVQQELETPGQQVNIEQPTLYPKVL